MDNIKKVGAGILIGFVVAYAIYATVLLVRVGKNYNMIAANAQGAQNYIGAGIQAKLLPSIEAINAALAGQVSVTTEKPSE